LETLTTVLVLVNMIETIAGKGMQIILVERKLGRGMQIIWVERKLGRMTLIRTNLKGSAVALSRIDDNKLRLTR
jgi:hypothetical protein